MAAAGTSGGGGADTHQFGNILLAGKDSHRDENIGALRMHANGFGWKSRKTGNVIAISKDDLRGADWIKIPHAYQLKLRAKGGFVYRFSGLQSRDKETIKGHCQSTFDVELQDVRVSYKGWNWGEAAVEGNVLSFRVEEEQTLEIPLPEITQAKVAKLDAVIELADDDTALPEDEMVCEVRMHIPATGDEEADPDMTPAEQFVDVIKGSADLEQAGTSLAAFDDLQVQVPRGRYDVELFDKYIQMHGKSFEYKVLYSNVTSLYLLPKPDGYNMALCVTLEHPLRHGATMYPHVLLQLPKEAVVETTVNLSDEELSRRFDDKLDAVESGDLPAVVAKVFSAFCKRKVQMIKNREGGFNSHIDDDKAKSLRCSLKTNDGFLFPLDKSFFFIANKPVMVEFERISSIEFNRVDKSSGSASRTFDITVHVKDGSGPHQFVNLQRSDYKELFRFLTAKKIRIKNIRAASDRAADFDDDDDGFAEDDPYMARMKREREEAAADDDDDDDDDGSSEDDDFRPGGESDVDEEYDEGDDAGSEAGGRRGGGGSESDGSEAPRAKKEKRGKKERKEGEGTPKKAKRVKKDKDAPKRGMSGYMLFMNGNRERFKEQNPGCKVTDIGRFAGAEWKEMDKEAREPWEEKARADKARYEREQAEYLEAHPEAAPQPKQKKERAPKAPKAPKPPKAPKAKAAAAPTYAHEDTSSSEEE